jgi:hypothetical protein
VRGRRVVSTTLQVNAVTSGVGAGGRGRCDIDITCSQGEALHEYGDLILISRLHVPSAAVASWLEIAQIGVG